MATKTLTNRFHLDTDLGGCTVVETATGTRMADILAKRSGRYITGRLVVWSTQSPFNANGYGDIERVKGRDRNAAINFVLRSLGESI